MLALISTLEYFRHYIDGQSVHLSTDHKNITWISNLKGQSGRLGRWVLRLSEFNVGHRGLQKGTSHVHRRLHVSEPDPGPG